MRTVYMVLLVLVMVFVAAIPSELIPTALATENAHAAFHQRKVDFLKQAGLDPDAQANIGSLFAFFFNCSTGECDIVLFRVTSLEIRMSEHVIVLGAEIPSIGRKKFVRFEYSEIQGSEESDEYYVWKAIHPAFPVSSFTMGALERR